MRKAVLTDFCSSWSLSDGIVEAGRGYVTAGK